MPDPEYSRLKNFIRKTGLAPAPAAAGKAVKAAQPAVRGVRRPLEAHEDTLDSRLRRATAGRKDVSEAEKEMMAHQIVEDRRAEALAGLEEDAYLARERGGMMDADAEMQKMERGAIDADKEIRNREYANMAKREREDEGERSEWLRFLESEQAKVRK